MSILGRRNTSLIKCPPPPSSFLLPKTLSNPNGTMCVQFQSGVASSGCLPSILTVCPPPPLGHSQLFIVGGSIRNIGYIGQFRVRPFDPRAVLFSIHCFSLPATPRISRPFPSVCYSHVSPVAISIDLSPLLSLFMEYIPSRKSSTARSRSPPPRPSLSSLYCLSEGSVLNRCAVSD